MHLVGFIIIIYHDARSPEHLFITMHGHLCQILLITFVAYSILKLSMIVVHESHVMRTATTTFSTFLEIWAVDGIEINFCVRPWLI